jgi:RecA-family ATPase
MNYSPDDLDYLDYLSYPSMAALDSEEGGYNLLQAITAYDDEVVVIDTVSRVITGEENSNDTWLKFYQYTGLRLKQLGVSMIRLDHTGKDESRGPRGGSAKSADVDMSWRLVKYSDQYLMLDAPEHVCS